MHTNTTYAANAHAGAGRENGDVNDLAAELGALAIATPIRSSLYDGLTLKIEHGPAFHHRHNPYDHHLALTSYDRDDKNNARFFLTFYAENGTTKHWIYAKEDIIERGGFIKRDNIKHWDNDHPKTVIAGSSGPEGALHGGTLFPRNVYPRAAIDASYKEFLGWLLELYPGNPSLTHAYSHPDIAFGDQGINRPYHHTEQWILWHIRKKLEAYVSGLLDENPGFRLNGMDINIYTYKNPCKVCGSSIEKALPFFEAQIAEMNARLGLGWGPVRVKSIISSTHPSDHPYLRMAGLTPNHAIAARDPSYQATYAVLHDVVKDAIIPLGTPVRCPSFWIPRLRSVTFSIENGLLKAKLNPWNFDTFLSEFSTHTHVTKRVKILDFGNGMDPVSCERLEFTTNMHDRSINPYTLWNPVQPGYMPFHLSVTNLLLHGTNARSLYMPNMLSTFAELKYLDLRGAVREYRDRTADADQPRRRLWDTLKIMPKLQYLNLGSYHFCHNSIKFQEFALLLGYKLTPGGYQREDLTRIPLPSIQNLMLRGNEVFNKSTNLETQTDVILRGFVTQPGRITPPLTIDLSQNGDFIPVSALLVQRDLSPATNIKFLED